MDIASWIGKCSGLLVTAGVHFGHGTENARDEAAWLVLHACGESCDGTFEDWGREVTEAQTDGIRALMKRRIEEGQPLAYLLGEAWFCGLRFKVSPAVLVPRSPVAELIHRGFSPWVSKGRLSRVLDLCTGSGCIAVATAHYLPGVSVDAVDISAAALEIAVENAALHGLEDRIDLVRSDLFANLTGRCYDLIVSNPPYVPAADMDSLPSEYLAEPAAGLVAGDDGLDIVLQILRQAPGFLSPSGVLICEVGESQERLQRVLEKVPFTWLEFEHGGGGVFTIGRQELAQAGPAIETVLNAR
jgi:ribosomal protein L3 glutamine methyltransferase